MDLVDEKEAIERALERETRMVKRQTLLKQLVENSTKARCQGEFRDDR